MHIGEPIGHGSRAWVLASGCWQLLAAAAQDAEPKIDGKIGAHGSGARPQRLQCREKGARTSLTVVHQESSGADRVGRKRAAPHGRGFRQAGQRAEPDGEERTRGQVSAPHGGISAEGGELNREVQEKQKDVLEGFRDKVEAVVAKVAKRTGLQVVIDKGKGGPTIFCDEELDISDSSD